MLLIFLSTQGVWLCPREDASILELFFQTKCDWLMFRIVCLRVWECERELTRLVRALGLSACLCSCGLGLGASSSIWRGCEIVQTAYVLPIILRLIFSRSKLKRTTKDSSLPDRYNFHFLLVGTYWEVQKVREVVDYRCAAWGRYLEYYIHVLQFIHVLQKWTSFSSISSIKT